MYIHTSVLIHVLYMGGHRLGYGEEDGEEFGLGGSSWEREPQEVDETRLHLRHPRLLSRE